MASRAPSRLALAAAVIALLAAPASWSADAAAKEKKKPAPAPAAKDPAIGKALDRCQRHLLAYATANARNVLKPVLPARNQDVEVAVAYARVLEQEKKYDEALEALDGAVDLDRTDPELHLARGEVLSRAERKAAAREAFLEARRYANRMTKKAAGDDQAVGLAHRQLGLAYLGLEQHANALTELKRARELTPDDATVLYQMGAAYSHLQQWQPAVDVLDAALAKNNGIAYAYFYRGLAAGKLGRMSAMINDLDRFLAIAPQAPEADAALRILQTVR